MFESLPLVLTIVDVQNILRIGKSQAYELAKRKDFPKLPIDKPIRVPRDEFLRWAKLI
ncbi:MAG: helix-turn-helix domain-containing protein [Clostridium sp.]